MKRRWIAALLACSMIGGMLAGCGAKETAEVSESGKQEAQNNLPVDEEGNPSPFGKYQEPVEVEIVQSISPSEQLPEGDTSTDNYFTRYIKDNMNIDIKFKWQAATADYAQKLSLSIASNDIPDLMVVSESDFKKLLKADMIEDLTPYYDTYACDHMKNVYEKTDGRAIDSGSVDGKLYGLPSVAVEADGYSTMWIRQDWLDELGLEAPATMAELETVAKAFVDNDMGGENTVGILGTSSNATLTTNFLASSPLIGTLDDIFQVYKSYPGFWVKGEDGKVVYGSTTQETKEALGKLQQLYKDGILDQELGMRKDSDEAWKGGKAGILFGAWWLGYSLDDCLANNPEVDWKAYPAPLAEDGKWHVKMGNNVGGVYCVVRKGYAHPEAAFILNNYLVRDESKMFQETTLGTGYWPGRILLGYPDECAFEYKQLWKKANGETPESYDPAAYKFLDADLEAVDTCLKELNGDLSIGNWNIEDTNFARTYSLLVGVGAQVTGEESGNMVKTYSETYSQTKTMEQKWANLKKKEDEIFLKIVIGDLELDAFDGFVDEWYAEGGEEITAEVQEEISN